ncbi:MAG: hypothetical protein ACOZE5_08040 [Verrucomicrobiota bacterium]
MKTIQVEVTEAQAEFINAMGRELGGVRPGDLLLAEAFTGIGCLDEDHLQHIIAGLKAFVVRRDLPKFDVRKLLPVGVHSRPAPEKPSTAAPTPVPEYGTKAITIHVSEDLKNLAVGFAAIRGQTAEEYVIETLMSAVEAACEAEYNGWHSSAPEWKAKAAQESLRDLSPAE